MIDVPRRKADVRAQGPTFVQNNRINSKRQGGLDFNSVLSEVIPAQRQVGSAGFGLVFWQGKCIGPL